MPKKNNMQKIENRMQYNEKREKEMELSRLRRNKQKRKLSGDEIFGEIKGCKKPDYKLLRSKTRGR